MTKQSKAFRLEADTWELLKDYADHNGLTQTEALAQAITTLSKAPETASNASTDENQVNTQELTIKALEAHVDTLREINSTLTEQLNIKDDQIKHLEQLQAGQIVTTAKLIEAPEERTQEKKKGLFARFFG